MLHAKAVPAEGRRTEAPATLAATCTAYDDGEGTLELLADHPSLDGQTSLEFTQAHIWHWAVASNHQPRRVTGDAVVVTPGARLIAALKADTGALQSVQLLIRLTGQVSSRPSAQVGQIEPDESCKNVAGAKVFLRLSEVVDALQLPAVGERVAFYLAPNPER